MIEQKLETLTAAIIDLTHALMNAKPEPIESDKQVTAKPELKAKPGPKPGPKPVPKVKPKSEPDTDDFFGESDPLPLPEPEVTLGMIRELAITLAKQNKREDMMNILLELGATKLTDLDASAYADAYSQLSALSLAK